MKKNNIENCKISETVKLGELNTLINTELGEQCMVGNFSKMAYSKMDTLSYIGDYTTIINSSIGKFTSISWGVTIGPEEHDFTRVTNHSFLYSTKSFQLVNKKQYSPFEKKCEIGNDVWIGCNSTILRGVTIGDGAVIGANSLVNKDVPPYSIVVGSPAKIIKYRFEEDIINHLIDIKWWELPLEVISENAELFAEKPTLKTIKKMKLLKER
ncbi:MAG: CatB-related O-acetyltransferase [Flavobacteriales bacterium]|nr:CatB-related O-acetyltransferase [Flavobacteriales bacterium]